MGRKFCCCVFLLLVLLLQMEQKEVYKNILTYKNILRIIVEIQHKVC